MKKQRTYEQFYRYNNKRLLAALSEYLDTHSPESVHEEFANILVDTVMGERAGGTCYSIKSQFIAFLQTIEADACCEKANIMAHKCQICRQIFEERTTCKYNKITKSA